MAEIIVIFVMLLLVYGIVGKRPGVSVAAMMLLAGGIFLAVTLLYFLRSVPSHVATQSIVMVDDEFGQRVLPPFASAVPDNHPRPAFLALLLIAGAAFVVIFFLRRAACSTTASGGHLRWWPVSLLLLLLPLFLFFFGSERIERTHHSTNWDPNFEHFEHAREVAEVERAIAGQQAELHRQAMEAAGEVQRRLASMNIYELMDKFDAPRIPLAVPPVGASDDDVDEVSDGSAAKAVMATPPSGSAVIVAAEAPVEIIAEAEASSEHGRATTGVAEAPRAVSTAPQGPPPAWVDQPPKRVGHVRREVIATDEYATKEECDLAADILLQMKTYLHIRWLTGIQSEYDSRRYIRDSLTLSPSELETGVFRQLQNAGITIDYIRREIAKDEYLKTVERSVGPMNKLYTLVEFTPAIDDELRRRWEASQRQARFAFVGFGASSVLGLLGLAWGLLKVDTMTKGYYTKRLFIGVPLGVVGLFGLYALLLEIGFDLPH